MLRFLKFDESLFISFRNNYEYIDFDLFNHIKKLKINDANNDHLVKLLSDKSFPNLEELEIMFCDISRIENKIFNGSFQTLQKLTVKFNFDLEIIDHDAFSNLKELRHLVIYYNSIESLDERTFSQLVNLESIVLRLNKSQIIDPNMFSNLQKLKTIDTNPSESAKSSPIIDDDVASLIFIIFFLIIILLIILFIKLL